MKRALLGLIIAITTVFVVFFAMGLYSGTGKAPGLDSGKLAPCPDKPNCVNSESSPSDMHSIAPIPVTASVGKSPLLKVREVIELLGGEVSVIDETYLAATFTSDLFRFVDDVEFRVDESSANLQVRSASRVGYSDLDANRKRVEQIRVLLGANQNN